MKCFCFDALLQKDGWLEPAYVCVDDDNIITSITTTLHQNIEDYQKIAGWIIPGFVNAHSHAFQYAMAGTAEHYHEQDKTDTFWTWRDRMYDLALTINPDHIEAIATFAYIEMAKLGYTSIVEFHYLHHDKDGKPYNNQIEISERIISAAQIAGIHLTLVPVYYQQSNFGIVATEKQRRFLFSSVDQYFQFIETLKSYASKYSHVNLGMGIHSLRAVNFNDTKIIINNIPLNTPFHLHISEQIKEVKDCVNFCQKRPVQWLADNVSLDERFFLVHATHISSAERKQILRSKANVVLCPSTEGNLGDGIFPLKEFQNANGKWCIGTDSQIGLNFFEELRWLDYHQRLKSHKRNPLCKKNLDDSGSILFENAIIHGRSAAGIKTQNYFETGKTFDAVVIDNHHPVFHSREQKYRLSTMIFASNSEIIIGTICKGKYIVKHHVHKNESQIKSRAIQTLSTLQHQTKP